MEVWILDENFAAVGMVDGFQSFIWTERYTGGGDFELYAPANLVLIDMLKIDRFVWVKNGTTMMLIESVEIESNIETGSFVCVTGRSAECIFERRVIVPRTVLDGSLEDAIYTLIDKNIMRPAYPQRQIPRITFRRSNDPRITSLTVSVQYYGENLYESITKLCDDATVGYRMVTTTAGDALTFELYLGENRTSSQNILPRVVFSRKMDNLIGSSFVESHSDYKNAAFILGEGEGSDRILAEVTVGLETGLQRREIFCDGSDVSRTYETTVQVQHYDPDQDEELQAMIAEDNAEEAERQVRIANPDADLTKYGMTHKYSIPATDETTGEVDPEYHNVIDLPLKVLPYKKDIEANYVPNDGFYYTTEVVTRTMTEAQYKKELQTRGRQELSAKNKTMTLDGEIPMYTNYIYGVDYNLGDIVEIEDEYGTSGYARINEFIISQDETGEYMYPTFSELN